MTGEPHALLLCSGSERVVRDERDAVVDLDEVVAGGLLGGDLGLGLLRVVYDLAARPHRRIAVDDRTGRKDRRTDKTRVVLARLVTPFELHWRARHVADG